MKHYMDPEFLYRNNNGIPVHSKNAFLKLMDIEWNRFNLIFCRLSTQKVNALRSTKSLPEKRDTEQ